MSPSDNDQNRQNEPLDTRLRIDPNKVAAARSLLEEIDQRIFAAAGKHGVDEHAGLISRAVKALFGHG